MRNGSSTPARHARHPYCLSCYSHLGPFDGSRQVCERCGFVNVKLDQQLFWTKEKRLVEWEAYAKIWIVFLLLVLGILLVWGFGRHASFGTGQGWAVGFPIVVGVILWESASKITRIKPYFRATIVWRILFAILGVPALLRAIEIGTQRSVGLLLYALGAVLLAGALGLGHLGRALERWRDRRILAGQESDSPPSG